MKSKTCAICVLVLIASVLGARGQNSSDESGHILALETAWNHALEQKDTAGLQMLLAKQMVALDSDGVLMNKAAFLAGIKSPDYQPAQVTNEKIGVEMFGSTAIVSGVYREKSTENGKTVVHRASFVDTWVKESDAWKCVASTAVTIPSRP
jgi:ketosteroid isomerase-like protein